MNKFLVVIISMVILCIVILILIIYVYWLKQHQKAIYNRKGMEMEMAKSRVILHYIPGVMDDEHIDDNGLDNEYMDKAIHCNHIRVHRGTLNSDIQIEGQGETVEGLDHIGLDEFELYAEDNNSTSDTDSDYSQELFHPKSKDINSFMQTAVLDGVDKNDDFQIDTNTV